MTTTETLAGIQRLRYRVYCDELGFLDASHCPEGYERDAYDPFSVQIAARESSGTLVGTLRLVLDSPLGFPIEAHAADLSADFRALPRAKIAEISRLVVDKGHRGMKSGSVRHLQPVLMVLFRTMYGISVELGLDYWLAAMEPSLHRALRHLVGFNFSEIGPPIEYHGEVVPYGVSIRYVEETLARRRPDNYYFFGVDRVRGQGPTSDPASSRRSAAVAAAYNDDLTTVGLEQVTIA